MRIASMAASRSAWVSVMPGRAHWISATIDGVGSFGLCASSVIAKDSSGSRPVVSSSVRGVSPILLAFYLIDRNSYHQ
jgi:hypothetical protein